MLVVAGVAGGGARNDGVVVGVVEARNAEVVAGNEAGAGVLNTLVVGLAAGPKVNDLVS